MIMQYGHNCMGQREVYRWVKRFGWGWGWGKNCTGIKDVRWRTVDSKMQIVRRTNKVYGTMDIPLYCCTQTQCSPAKRNSIIGVVLLHYDIRGGERSRVRFQMESKTLSFQQHNGPGVDSASNRNEYQRYLLEVKKKKKNWCVGLTTLSEILGTSTSWGPKGLSRPFLHYTHHASKLLAHHHLTIFLLHLLMTYDSTGIVLSACSDHYNNCYDNKNSKSNKTKQNNNNNNTNDCCRAIPLLFPRAFVAYEKGETYLLLVLVHFR
jgi:hypothetical protein